MLHAETSHRAQWMRWLMWAKYVEERKKSKIYFNRNGRRNEVHLPDIFHDVQWGFGRWEQFPKPWNFCGLIFGVNGLGTSIKPQCIFIWVVTIRADHDVRCRPSTFWPRRVRSIAGVSIATKTCSCSLDFSYWKGLLSIWNCGCCQWMQWAFESKWFSIPNCFPYIRKANPPFWQLNLRTRRLIQMNSILIAHEALFIDVRSNDIQCQSIERREYFALIRMTQSRVSH